MINFPVVLEDCDVSWTAFQELRWNIKGFSQTGRNSYFLLICCFAFFEEIWLNDHGSCVMQNYHVLEAIRLFHFDCFERLNSLDNFTSLVQFRQNVQNFPEGLDAETFDFVVVGDQIPKIGIVLVFGCELKPFLLELGLKLLKLFHCRFKSQLKIFAK